MYSKHQGRPNVITWRQFSNKGYSAFASLHRQVRIGVLSVATLAVAAQTHARLNDMVVTPTDEKETIDEGEMAEVTVSGTLAPLTQLQSARIVSVLSRQDIEQAIPMVDDAHLSVPKYHFNLQAAYAFAARFYLYAEEWDEAVRYADLCLGSEPKPLLRDWANVATMTQQVSAITQHYISADLNCNLLLMTGYSKMGLAFGPYSIYSRYAHGAYLATNEDGNAVNIWGASMTADRRSVYYSGMKVYTATNLDKTLFWKLPYLFEYTDAVAGIGYYHTVYPAFTADECLLNRAEAKVMLRQYDEAAADLDLWMNNILDTSVVHLTLTPDTIQRFYNSVRYSYEPSDMDPQGLRSTIKKHLHPAFAIDAEGSTQEAMLQCVLGFRRIETLQTGLRWFDIKRYGMEIKRRVINAAGIPERQTDILLRDDPRRAVQIPLKVRQAGLEPNERN